MIPTKKTRLAAFIRIACMILLLTGTVLGVTTFIGGPGSSTEVLDFQTFRYRNLFVPGNGFVAADFSWNGSRLSWDFNGNFSAETPVFSEIQLWENYFFSSTPVGEQFRVSAGGVGVTGVSFVSPQGNSYSNFTYDGNIYGLDIYTFEINLPVGQTEFGDGEYVFTFDRTAGAIQKSFFISGSYPVPDNFEITHPLNGSTQISTTPTVTWESVGAASYDFLIRDSNGNEVYGEHIFNSVDSDLSHTIPGGYLLPNTDYVLTIEAEAPEVNGGQKGLKKSSAFKTAP